MSNVITEAHDRTIIVVVTPAVVAPLPRLLIATGSRTRRSMP